MPIRETVDLLRLNADLGWAAAEYAQFLWAEPLARRVAPKPKSANPVLSIPGFSGPEFTLAPMTRFLRKVGFDAKTWGMGTNKGPQGGLQYLEKLAEQMGTKIEKMADDSGQKVSLVGHSLGGIYARELARVMPDYIDRVITLGSPAHLDVLRSMRSVNRLVTFAFDKRTGKSAREIAHDQHDMDFHDMNTPPPGIPLVAVYSPYDGVVTEDTTAIPPEYLHSPNGTPRENIEVICSHCGMVLNAMVLVAICDRLLADPKKWKPFDATSYVPSQFRLLAEAFFPEPVHLGMRTPVRTNAEVHTLKRA